jgi:hypothetical protein
LVGTAGVVVSLISLRWPLLRYLVLFVPFLALAAAWVVAGIPGRLRFVVGAAAAIAPLFASLAQVNYMTSPHPANQMMQTIVRTIPEGTPVARLMAKLIPLSLAIYPLGPNPFMDDLNKTRPEWVVITDLPDGEHPGSTRQLIAEHYAEIAHFRTERASSWATLGEAGAPHDWKYTHPEMILYRRKP